ncbi:hypothetical protein KM043_011963 [Ampulex compressa]|nr:hypothetical protein KM043_011963 [Ampulex compressa]
MTTQLIQSIGRTHTLLKRLAVFQNGIISVKRDYLFLEKSCHSQIGSDKDNPDKPIVYSKSLAATWKAAHTRKPQSDMPWYGAFVISFSTAVFLIYFCILREENDIDEMLKQDLSDHFFKNTVASDNTTK